MAQSWTPAPAGTFTIEKFRGWLVPTAVKTMTFALWLKTDIALALINQGVGEAGLRQAWKEQNRNERPETVALWPQEKAVKKTPRQEFQELLEETEDMIQAAKRQGHWQLLPALLQRHNTFAEMVAHRAII